MWKMGFYLQGQGHRNWILVHTIKYDYFYYMFWTADFLATNLVWQCMFISWSVLWKGCFAVFEVRSQWRFWTSANVCPDNISDRSNLVWWCIIISQSIIQKYHFAMFKVKATIVSTRSSQILKLLQSKLVWWYIITRQSKTLWKDFLAFTQGIFTREYGLGDCGLVCCHSWLSPYLKQGQYRFQSRKCGKNIAFVMNILVY